MIAWIEAAIAPWHATALLVAAIAYATLALLHDIITPAHIAAIMSPLALATAAATVMTGLYLKRLPNFVRARIFFLIAGLMWVNSTSHLAMDPRAELATNLAVAILACAVFLIRLDEFAVGVAACIGSFLAIALNAPPSPEWLHFGVHIFECSVIATVLFAIKRAICLSAANAQMLESAQRRAAEVNAQKAERLHAAKSLFMANMSHELRTPLNAIIGFSDILRMGTLPHAKVQDYAEQVHKSGIYLLASIDQVLDIVQNDTTISETKFGFAEMWNDIVRETQQSSEMRSIRFDASATLVGVQIQGDPRRIKAAIDHLVANAIKFTPSLGKVSLSARILACGSLEICVEDDGIGIAARDLERVFEPFFQADHDYAKRYQGLGVGLALVRQFIRAHGGDADLTSVEGRGTTARLLLPASRINRTETETSLAAAC